METLPGDERSDVIGHIVAGLAMSADTAGDIVFEALQRAFRQPLPKRSHHYYGADCFKPIHSSVVAFLKTAADPKQTPLFEWYFYQRGTFSEDHLQFYRILAKAAYRAASRSLVEPLLDLLTFDDRMIVSGKVLKKNCLVSLARLGDARDVARIETLLADTPWESPDIVEAYEKALIRLSQKKPVYFSRPPLEGSCKHNPFSRKTRTRFQTKRYVFSLTLANKTGFMGRFRAMDNPTFPFRRRSPFDTPACAMPCSSCAAAAPYSGVVVKPCRVISRVVDNRNR